MKHNSPLNSTEDRMIKILNYLFFCDGWILLQDLAAQVGATEKAVMETLEQIKTRWGQTLGIYSDPKRGLILQSRSTAQLRAAISSILRESETFRLIQLLYKSPFGSAADYAQQLYISVSSLRRLVSKLNRIFSDMNMQIHSRDNELYLTAKNEAYLCKHIACTYIEMFGLDQATTGMGYEADALRHIVFDHILDSNYMTEDLTIDYYIAFAAVILTRYNQGFEGIGQQMANLPAPDKTIEMWQWPENLQAYMKQTFPHVHSRHLTMMRRIFQQTNLPSTHTPEAQAIISKASQTLSGIYEQVQLQASSALLQKLAVQFYYLYLDFTTYPYPTSLFLDRVDYFVRGYHQANPQLCAIVSTELEKLIKSISPNMLIQQNTIVYRCCLSDPRLCSQVPAARILLIHDLGYEAARIWSQRLQQALQINGNQSGMVVDTLLYDKLDQKQVPADYDLVLTTNLDLKAHAVPLLLIDDYPTGKSIGKVLNRLRQGNAQVKSAATVTAAVTAVPKDMQQLVL
ncbi:hypothetical protein HCH52_00280 [Oscillospiraceae bacterium HV4-5-C5C]|nr:hypothetical protein [Oscillospiraceae bacterium HV4-5-C5C]